MPRERLKYKVSCDYVPMAYYTDELKDAQEHFEQLKKEHGDGIRLFEILERYNSEQDDWDIIDEEVIDYFDAEPEEEN